MSGLLAALLAPARVEAGPPPAGSALARAAQASESTASEAMIPS